MNENGHWDEVESLVSLSDATIHSQSDDESQDSDNDLEATQAQEHDVVTREDGHEYDEEDDEEEPRPQNQNSSNSKENVESETPEPKGSIIISNKEVKTTIDKNISDKLDPMNKIESDLQTNDIDIPGEKSSGEEEKKEPEDGLLDGGFQELPFVRSVKYLEKHEIFRLFQNLAAEIVYQRPDNPLQFIVDKLEKEKQESQRKPTENTSPNEDRQPLR